MCAEVSGYNLGLKEGIDLYLNLNLCDSVGNCHIVGPGYPIVFDSSPPERPMRMLASRHDVTSMDGLTQYFITRERIDPIWVFSPYDRSRARFSPGSRDGPTAKVYDRVVRQRQASNGETWLGGTLPVGPNLEDPW